MKRLLILLLAPLAAWLGAGATAAAAALPANPEFVQGYTYDSNRTVAMFENTVSERGPPATCERGTTNDAVDLCLRGNPPCPDADRNQSHTDYDIPAQAVRVDSDSATTRTAPGGLEAELRVPEQSGVAANSGSRLAEASSSAFHAADNVGGFSVSAKHLPGAGGRWNKWAEGVDINGTIANALRSDGATFLPNAGGAADTFIVRTNVGSIIGTKGQTFVKAVVSNDGRIITAYPVK